MKKKDYILWLPSWYPNQLEPYSGDFIQRHARAAAIENHIKLIFFTQFGETVYESGKVIKNLNGNLEEIIVYVPFKPIGYRILDRLRYNISFYRYAKRTLRKFFAEHGVPALVHVHVPVKSGNLAVWIKRKFGVPYIVSEQSSTYLRTAPDFFLNRHWFHRLQVKKIFKGAQVVTNVSHAVSNVLKDLFGLDRITVIHNVVDTSLFFPVQKQGDRFTYIHVSSLGDQKNINGILRSFKRLALKQNDWVLIVVGPCTDELKLFVEAEMTAGLIIFTGEIPYAEVAKQMQRSDAFVLFSKHENFPCVVVEALCCGLPVISSNVAGIGEAVQASNGILVAPGDEDAFFDALVKIRERHGSTNAFSIAAAAKKKYCYSVIGYQFTELYSKLLNNKQL